MDSLYLALGLFFLYSFFGWLAEVAFSVVSRKKFVNTGFLTGPVCPIYGVGILFILRFLEPLRNDLFFLFVGSTVVATVLEYATNRFLEGLTGTKWWDYSRFRFHFGGYVCLPFSAFWGAGAVAIVRWINPLVVRLVQLIPVPVGRVILLGCVILLGLDLIATAGTMVRMRPSVCPHPLSRWRPGTGCQPPGTAQRSHPRTHPAPYGAHRSPALPA